MINFLILLLLLYLLLVVWMNLRHPAVRWKEHKINIAEYTFPKSFFWGAATSAYQVEGGSYNADWAEWEKTYDVSGNPRIKNGDRCGKAADHWNRYREDLRLLKDFGCNSYRFSVEWSKLVPQPGKWNPAAADHYVEMCRFMRDLEIEPNLTLHHFTLPRWLAEKGGFEHPDSINYFMDFTHKTAETLGPYVDYWATFNEPVALALMGWIRGVWSPGKQDICLAARVLGNILEAHQQAYRILHATIRQDSDGDGVPCRVGIVKNITIFDPARKWYLPDWLCTTQINKLYNDAVLDAFHNDRFRFNLLNRVRYRKELPGLSDTLDWIGVNYYTRFLTKFDPNSAQRVQAFPAKKLPKTDMDWAVCPAGLYRALQRVNGFGVPIFITENGIATDDDQLRKDFILKHVDALHEAILDKIDVRGYYYWSLMDNFEWAEGFAKRFGLYYVDYQTQERTLKNGTDIYREIIAQSRSKE
ncbi:MAG TPA: glycosyl hydrolase family protein [Candidatus Marinimicrobia bacterium]|nr:glycosyl hydrolase family protein [Candidatus Neomarinimicrobiota bacterium]